MRNKRAALILSTQTSAVIQLYRVYLGVLPVEMPGQPAHEDDDTLPHEVVAGVIWGRVQEVLEHGEQVGHRVLA